MKLKIFAVYDSKVEAYLQPFFMANKGTAIRAISDLLHDSQHQFSKYPQDFTLFELGEYDDSNGEMQPYPAKLAVSNILELRTEKQQPSLTAVQ